MKGKISQRDIARLAGVSPMTVSLALRGHPSIPETTRSRIRAVAKEHHYRPDPALSALNAWRIRETPSHFQGTLAWITSFPSREGWRGMIQAAGYFEGAQARAGQLGYRIEEFWISEPNLSARRATQILSARGVRGIIVAPLPSEREEIRLGWEHFPAVALGYSLRKPHLHVVMNHQFRNMKQVVQCLQKLGYRRIGFAMPSANDERVDHNYLGGYWVAQRDFSAGMAHLPPLLAKPFDPKAFLSWFRKTQPDAVVVSAAMAYQVIEWLKEIDLRVPEHVGLAVAAVPYRDRFISGIDEDVPAIGAQAVEAVVGMIHRNEQGIPSCPLSLLLEGTWSRGKTARKQKH